VEDAYRASGLLLDVMDHIDERMQRFIYCNFPIRGKNYDIEVRLKYRMKNDIYPDTTGVPLYELPLYVEIYDQGAYRKLIKEDLEFQASSLDDFNEQIRSICPYHVNCGEPGGCMAELITSPKVTCGICLVEQEVHLLQETKCGHHFHLKCLDELVSRSRNQSPLCPMCRGAL
jgi:hypothetical protein